MISDFQCTLGQIVALPNNADSGGYKQKIKICDLTTDFHVPYSLYLIPKPSFVHDAATVCAWNVKIAKSAAKGKKDVVPSMIFEVFDVEVSLDDISFTVHTLVLVTNPKFKDQAQVGIGVYHELTRAQWPVEFHSPASLDDVKRSGGNAFPAGYAAKDVKHLLA